MQEVLAAQCLEEWLNGYLSVQKRKYNGLLCHVCPNKISFVLQINRFYVKMKKKRKSFQFS